jgi:hypothetical protein
MNPDVVEAIPRLVERGTLPAERAPLLTRVARGELVSVRVELRLLLYIGVLVVTSGVGLLVKENLDRIGPVAIAAALGLAAAAAIGWVWRGSPPFTWERVESPHLAFDYILLLGVLLAAADLAYIEARFTPLGTAWPWHLLIVALFAAAVAVRFDSRVVFSLALATFAAWQGVSMEEFGLGVLAGEGPARWTSIGCGVFFVVLGIAMARTDRKAHFEPVAVHLGWLLVLGGIASGIVDEHGAAGWAAALLLVGATLAAWAYQARRFPLFAYGVLSGYVGVCRFIFEGDETLGCFFLSFSSILVIVGLVMAQRRLRGAA